MVLVFHATLVYAPPGLDPISRLFMKYGFLGVDIFFPLSGFLITRYLLIHHDRAAIKVFFSRRIFRILPLYFLAILTFVVASLALSHEREILVNIWQNLLFLTGWIIFHVGRSEVPYTITWSLSVEEFAYILIGLSALFLRRRLPVALIAIATFSVALRFYLDYSDFERIYYYPPARLDSIALGGILAWMMKSNIRGILAIFIFCLLSTLVIANIFPVFWGTLLYVHITLMTCIAIFISVEYFSDIDGFFVRGVASVGFYSYFIYLFHYFNVELLILVMDYLNLIMPFWFFVFTVLGTTYVQALVSFRFFENPLMSYGRRREGRWQ